MANNNPDIEALRSFQAKRQDDMYNSVIDAINHTLAAAEELTISGLSRKTGVSRKFIHGNEKLISLIYEKRQISTVRHSASIHKARENARIRALENKLQAVTERCKSQAQTITELTEQNLKLKLYIEEMSDTNVVSLHTKNKK